MQQVKLMDSNEFICMTSDWMSTEENNTVRLQIFISIAFGYRRFLTKMFTDRWIKIELKGKKKNTWFFHTRVDR